VVRGRSDFPGGPVSLDASSSSQLVSALLLPAARWQHGVDVTHTGERPVPNVHHLRMTAAMLRDRGVDVDDSAPGRWRVRPGAIAARDENIEPDLSTVAPFLAAAVVTGGEAVVPHWPASSHQPGAVLPELLEAFGAKCRHDGDALVVAGAEVRGTDLDLRDAGELTPVLAAVAALATSPTTLRGIGYLRGHETDRLAALSRELNALGGHVTELDDGLRIEPARLHEGLFHTYADHRLAMAAAVVGAVVPGVLIEDVATTAKTFPGFADAWTAYIGGASR
jgi:3-phosphoshikimate 1-carboxyvinyltransferase